MEYGCSCHANVNHLYDGKPYAYHLDMVHGYAVKYLHLILDPEEEVYTILDVLASTWTHDTIEDCRITYSDLLKVTNEYIADLTYAVSNEIRLAEKDDVIDFLENGISNIENRKAKLTMDFNKEIKSLDRDLLKTNENLAKLKEK